MGVLAGLVLAFSVQAKQVSDVEFVRTNVLGTSFEMSIKAPQAQAEQAELAVLDEIKRLEKIFSTYDKSSEVSLLNESGLLRPEGASADFIAVVSHCEKWQKALPKSFSCRLGKVIDMWDAYEKQQQRPNRVDIRAQARAAQLSRFTREDLLAGKTNQDFRWRLDGIAKGYILDKAMIVAKATASLATAIKIDIGGDGVYWQVPGDKSQQWRVGLALPNKIDDSQENRLGTLEIAHGAIAYSGHNSRARKIGRRSYSHIIVPRDGWPAHNPVTAIVKAPDATSADALATALAASEISTSLDWLDKHPEYAALLIDNQGRQYASGNWYQGYQQSNAVEASLTTAYQANIRFSLPKMNVSDYRKPYVALWIADPDGKVLKNLLILGRSERWMQESRTWWRIQGRKAPQLFDGFARPTRRPGQYQVVWNGRDDFGQALPIGEYLLFAEVVREHGDREKLSIPFNLAMQNQSISKKGKAEIGALTFESLVTVQQ